MALRVLLADESPTIKKVFQLALQDYGVDVKAVNVGVDVHEVAKSFRPDIIFADVLLQQLSGYQVSSELKASEDFHSLPIVLMWSGFMEIDDDKFLACHADAKLEKPFEVEQLRDLIQQLVPKVQSQKLSEYLDFPDMPDFDSSPTPLKPNSPVKVEVHPPHIQNQTNRNQTLNANSNPRSSSPPPLNKNANEQVHSQVALGENTVKRQLQEADQSQRHSNWNMEDFESVDITQQMPSRTSDELTPQDDQFLQSSGEESSEWIQSPISSFKLDLDNHETLDEEDLPIEHVLSEQAVAEATRQSTLVPPIPRSTQLNTPLNRVNKHQTDHQADEDLEIETPIESEIPTFDVSVLPQLGEERIAEIIKLQSAEIIERIAWKIVPEIATQIIERELKRLIEEQNSNDKRI